MEYKFCFKCKWEGETSETLCPRCHKKLKSRSFIRGTGAVMAMLGAFLVVLLSAIIFWMWNLIEQTGKPGSTARFTGTKSEMVMAFGVLGAVLLFGFIALITGLWQLVIGRRNLILVYILLVLAAGLYIGGSIVLHVFDK
jgi:hypothetical protein